MADSTTPSVPFSMHRRAAYGAVVVALGMASLAELVAVHLLVVRWSPTGAWALTALSVYGLAWLLADYHAVRTGPHVLHADRISLRRGRLFRAEVPIEQMAEVRLPSADEKASPSEAVDLMMWLPAAPWVVMEFGVPVSIKGPGPFSRPVSRLGVPVDEPAAFREAVRRAMTDRSGARAPFDTTD